MKFKNLASATVKMLKLLSDYGWSCLGTVNETEGETF